MPTFQNLTRYSSRTLDEVADHLEQGRPCRTDLHNRIARMAHALVEEQGLPAVTILRSAAATVTPARTDGPTAEPTDADLDRMLAFAHELRQPSDDGEDLADRVDPDLGQGMSTDRLQREADKMIRAAAKAALLAAHYLELAEGQS